MAKNSEKTSLSQEFIRITKKVNDKLKPLRQKLLDKCSNINVLSKKTNFEELKDYFELLEAVVEIEKPFSPRLPCREKSWEKFLHWSSENGADFKSVCIKEVDGKDYGLVAEENISENEAFLKVPRKIMMSQQSAKLSKLGPLISKDPILQHMPNVQLAVFLIMELLNCNSFWRPYISVLPSSLSTVLYFTLDDLMQLQGSPVLDEIFRVLYSVGRQYCYFSHMFQTDQCAKSLNIGPYFTYDLYRWAVSVVMTRQNLVPSPDGSDQLTSLIPLFDMCNHSNGRLSTDFSLESDMLISYSDKSCLKGEEVFMFYGPRTNAEFFVHNGFVYPDNENDAVEIKIGFGKTDSLLSLKKELCDKLKISMNGPFYLRKGSSVPEDLLLFLQINVMKKDELQNYLNCGEKELLLNDSDLKQRALRFLKDRIFLLLKCYKTTLEEDEEVLKSAVPESHIQSNILLHKMCEKRILNAAHKYCTESTS